MRRLLTLVLASSIAALATAPVADAASAKRCKTAAKKAKAKVIKKSSKSLVARRGKAQEMGQRFYGCLYSKPKLYKFSNIYAGDTDFYSSFKLNGRFLAYVHSNQEHAAQVFPSWVEVVDLKARKQVHMFDAFPTPGDDAITASIHGLILQPNGAVAWIGDGGDELAVQSALISQKDPVVADRGPNIGKKSLTRVGKTQFSWLKGTDRFIAPFGGMPTAGTR